MISAKKRPLLFYGLNSVVPSLIYEEDFLRIYCVTRYLRKIKYYLLQKGYILHGKKKFLIVEDEVIAAMNMKICVKVSFYQIHVVYNIHSINLEQILFNF